MIIKRFLPFLIALAMLKPCLFAHPPGVLSGAIGQPGSRLSAQNTFPFNATWGGILGQLNLVISKSNSKSPHGTYSAALLLEFNGKQWSYRSKGNLEAEGLPDSVEWKSFPADAPFLDLSLKPSLTDSTWQGSATLQGVSSPVIAFRHTHHAKSNPLPAEDVGACTVFLTDPTAETPGFFGSAAFKKDGSCKFTILSSAGEKYTATSAVLESSSEKFLLAFLGTGKSMPVGLWAHRVLSQSDSDWNGYASSSRDLPWNVAFARYKKPSRGQPVVSWFTADLYAAHEEFFVATATVEALSNGKFISSWGYPLLGGGISFNSANGQLSGSIHYWRPTAVDLKPQQASLRAFFNQKSGQFLGSVTPKGSLPGIFDITPRR